MKIKEFADCVDQAKPSHPPYLKTEAIDTAPVE